MTGNTIPPPDLDLLARRAKVERETADSAEAQTLMDPIFPAMLACSGYLDSLGLIWGKEYELLAHNLVAVLDFASNTFSIKLGAADLPAVDPNGRALLDTLAAAMRAYADFTLRRGLIWDPARQELAVTHRLRLREEGAKHPDLHAAVHVVAERQQMAVDWPPASKTSRHLTVAGGRCPDSAGSPPC